MSPGDPGAASAPAAALSGTVVAVVSAAAVSAVVVADGVDDEVAGESVVGLLDPSSLEHPAITAAVAPAPASRKRRRSSSSRAREVGRSPGCIRATVEPGRPGVAARHRARRRSKPTSAQDGDNTMASLAAGCSAPYGRWAWIAFTWRSSTSGGCTTRSTRRRPPSSEPHSSRSTRSPKRRPGSCGDSVDDEGQSSSYVRLPGDDDPLSVVNMSVWEDIDALKHFMYKSGHAIYLRRRIEWFERSDVATSACWWIPAGDLPTLADAHRRLLHLREHGPTSTGWPINSPAPRDN